MKIIKYNLPAMINAGTPEDPEYVVLLSAVEMPWSEANEVIAKEEAYNGEYEIYDDGQPDPIQTPTLEEKVDALEQAVTMLCMPDVSEV